jgi:UDP-glucose 4-epimerase
MSTFLITGGAGFIGSHTILVLLQAGHRVVALDNFHNSSPESLKRVQELVGSPASERLFILEGDIRCQADLERAFAHNIDAVIHFAGLKAVAESVAQPLLYWDVNLSGSRQLLAAMQVHNCRTVVFSSSATLYGTPDTVPISEAAPIRPINPYGQSKAAVEQLLENLSISEPGWRIARLRYFNPVGAHVSGRIGEDPNGIPSNLFPFISQVAIGKRDKLQVYGDDWETQDGTGVRDYIHVMDLAEGHEAAVLTLLQEEPQLLTLNLGSGSGYSVVEVVRAFEQASGRTIPYSIVERRPGDAAISVADPSLAHLRLGWRTKRSLPEMCRDSWTWQCSNPEGYGRQSHVIT